MKDEKLNNRITLLKETINQALKTRKPTNADYGYFENSIAYLKNMYDELIKLEDLNWGKREPTVGVFGCPTRGKSTLLNVLLGVDILPMKGWPGTTRFGTMLRYKNISGFNVIANFKSKPPEMKEAKTEKDVREVLENLASRADVENPDLSTIVVEGPFRSFIGKNFTFMDTPGVELGTSKEANDVLKHDFEADTQRALAILSSVDVVIFCMILNYKEGKDAEFYKQHMMGYNPINVINAGDKREEGQTDDDLKKQLRKEYNIYSQDTVVISSLKALEIIRQAPPGADIVNHVQEKFTGENLGAFMELKQMLLERTGSAKEHIEKRITRLADFYSKNIRADASQKGIEFPSIITKTVSMDSSIESIVSQYIDQNKLPKTALDKIKGYAREYDLEPIEAVKLLRQRWKKAWRSKHPVKWFFKGLLKIIVWIVAIIVFAVFAYWIIKE